MFVNLPKLTKKDIKFVGELYKDESKTLVISDLDNDKLSNSLFIKGCGWFEWVYNVADTWLVLVENCKGKTDIKHKNIDFIGWVYKFEVELASGSRCIRELNIPSTVFTITSKQRALDGFLRGGEPNLIQTVVEHHKPHLKPLLDTSKSTNLKLVQNYLTDNSELIGIDYNTLAVQTMYQKKLYLWSVEGIHIIKYEHTQFD